MNENAVPANVFGCGNADLAAEITYKCHVHRMDSMLHVRDNEPKVYFCMLCRVVNNEDYRLNTREKCVFFVDWCGEDVKKDEIGQDDILIV